MLSTGFQDLMDTLDQTTDDVSNVVKSFKTPNGKVINIVIEPNHSFYAIQFGSGGEAPAEFEGMHTTIPSAEAAVKAYLLKKQVQADKKPTKPESLIEFVEAEKELTSGESKRK